jgi:predicted transcriptional regulator
MLSRGLFTQLKGKGARSRRDVFLIISDILVLAASGIRKTELMSKAGLSSEQLHKYMPILANSDLLETSSHEKKIVYKTTEKGKSFLQTLEALEKMLT